MTILVLEDDQLVLDVFESLLRVRGHHVLAASDPAEAASLLARHGRPPDALLVDVALSGESGIAYARQLRDTYPSLAVVLTTGFPNQEPIAMRSGLGPLLRKPFRAEELFAVIDGLKR